MIIRPRLRGSAASSWLSGARVLWGCLRIAPREIASLLGASPTPLPPDRPRLRCGASPAIPDHFFAYDPELVVPGPCLQSDAKSGLIRCTTTNNKALHESGPCAITALDDPRWEETCRYTRLTQTPLLHHPREARRCSGDAQTQTPQTQTPQTQPPSSQIRPHFDDSLPAIHDPDKVATPDARLSNATRRRDAIVPGR
jgi:hypothetical protein